MLRSITLGLAGCVALVAIGACATPFADVFALRQPACEPATGLTYSARLREIDNVTVVGVERAAAPDARCSPPRARLLAQKLEAKVMCLASDGTSLAIGWDEEKGRGAGVVSSRQLPGCLK